MRAKSVERQIIDYLAEEPNLHTVPFALQMLAIIDISPPEEERLLKSFAKQGKYSGLREVLDRRFFRSTVIVNILTGMLESASPSDPWPFRKLRETGPSAASATPVLIHMLRSTNSELRFQSAWTLQEIGPGAISAVPALRGCTGDENVMVRNASLRAIEAIQGMGQN
jgi:hypothetical protein